MKIQFTKANAFQIEPGKKYVVIITNKDNALMESDIDDLRKQLEPMGMTVVFLPKGTRYKLVEATDKAA